MKIVLTGSPTAEPTLHYSPEQLATGWETYGEELLKGRDPEELGGYRRSACRGSPDGPGDQCRLAAA